MTNDYHEIEAYLSGEMPDTEARAFEQRLNTDSQLRELFMLSKGINHHLTSTSDNGFENDPKEQEDIVNFIRSEEGKALRKKLEVLEKLESNRRSVNRRWVISIAAAAVVLLFSLLPILNGGDTVTNQELVQQYYYVQDLPSLVSRGGAQETRSNGVEAFKNGDFARAIGYFESLDKQTTVEESPGVLIYLALSYHQNEQNQEALSLLDEIIESDTLERPRALWFKALIALDMDNRELARLALIELTKDTSNFNYTKATQLLDQIETN